MGKTKGKHQKTWAWASMALLLCTFILFTQQYLTDSRFWKQDSSSNQISTSGNIVPTLLMVSIQQDSSHNSEKKPVLDPVPNNDPGQPQSQPKSDPNSTSPTWVQMIGAIVNVFLSLYQSF